MTLGRKENFFGKRMSVENESYGQKWGIPGIGKTCMEKEVMEKGKKW